MSASKVILPAVSLAEVHELAGRLPDRSLDAASFDPPYHLPKPEGTENKDWGVDKCDGGYTIEKGLKELPRYDRTLEEDLAFMDWCESWGRAVLPKLKPGASILSFCSTKTIAYLTVGLRKAGFQIRDQWAYAYSKSTPFGMTEVSKQIRKLDAEQALKFEGWKNRLPCAYEPVCVARRPLDGTIAENVKKWGLTGGFNVGGNMISPNRMPSNILSFEEGALAEFDKFFFSSKATDDEKDLAGFWEFTENAPDWFRRDFTEDLGRDYFFDEDLVGLGADVRLYFQPLINDHPTIKNVGACQAMLSRIVLPGMTVFDGFCGSGSILVAGYRMGCTVIGGDNSARSVRISKARLHRECLRRNA